MEYEIAINNTAVYADGGTIKDNFTREKVATFLKRNDLWTSCVGFWVGAHKVDGNQLVSKMYDIKGNTDLLQEIGANQFTWQTNNELQTNGDDYLKSGSLGVTNKIRTALTKMTYSIWVKPVALNTSEKYISARYTGVGDSTWLLGFHSLQSMYVYLFSANAVRKLFRSMAANVNEWKMLTFSFDGEAMDGATSGLLKMYINGVLLTSLTKEVNSNLTTLNDLSTVLSVGATGIGANSVADGTRIALSAYHNIVLSDAQVLAFYNNTKGIYGLL